MVILELSILDKSLLQNSKSRWNLLGISWLTQFPHYNSKLHYNFFWEKNTGQFKKKICIERLFLFFKCCHTNNKDPLPWSDEDWNAAPPQVGPQSTAATIAWILKFCPKIVRPHFIINGARFWYIFWQNYSFKNSI